MRFVLEWLAGAGGFGGMMVARTMVQYLPWTIGHQPTGDVEAVLDQIEQALGRLRSLEDRDGSWRDRG